MFLIYVQLLTVISKWAIGHQILQMCCVFSSALIDFLRGSSLKVQIAGYSTRESILVSRTREGWTELPATPCWLQLTTHGK